MHRRPRLRRRGDEVRTIAGLLLATVLVLGSSCARSDWIDRTLVTDVTGRWSGGWTGRSSEILFELEQQGSTVKGLLQIRGVTGFGDPSGPIEGTVGGDVFRFRATRGSVEGEMTVNGDEMIGLITISSVRRPLSLQRVDPSSLPASPPR